ncbi:MAG TPA: alpha/beta fold hydrolase [Candidatus Limnocylindrales bacterium]|nr:alpha/beta fold hydrolase [Candidatus Limnocylindrales bacterium]
MTDTPDEPIALRPPIFEDRPPKPVRKDEIELADRGLFIESWLPERRSRRHPLLMVHGELGGSWLWHRFQEYLAGRGFETHALNLRGHYWSDVADLEHASFDDYADDLRAAVERIGRGPVLVGHGMGALLCLAIASGEHVSGLVLLGPMLPGELRSPARPYELRAVPAVFRRDFIGWRGLPEAIRRENPDLTLADVLRIQHLMGGESGAVRRDALAGISVGSSLVREVPALVVGGGLDREHPLPDTEALALWLGAEFEPFADHSHYGLVAGETSHEPVAARVRHFLDEQRL